MKMVPVLSRTTGKIVILSLLLCICLSITAVFNIYKQTDILYTHLFYIPLLLSAFWFGWIGILISVVLGLIHIQTNLLLNQSLSLVVVYRAISFVVFALVVYLLVNRIKNKSSRNALNALQGLGVEKEVLSEIAVTIGDEVRNPMTTVRGFIQLMNNDRNCKKYKEYFELMIEEIDRANRTISDIMVFADNKAFSSEVVDLNSFALEIEPSITEITKPLGIRLYWDLQANHGLIVNKKQLRKLIINLIYYLTNNYPAIKLLTLRTECNKQGVILKITAAAKERSPRGLGTCLMLRHSPEA
jgi:signal transduction histidine kinase